MKILVRTFSIDLHRSGAILGIHYPHALLAIGTLDLEGKDAFDFLDQVFAILAQSLGDAVENGSRLEGSHGVAINEMLI